MRVKKHTSPSSSALLAAVTEAHSIFIMWVYSLILITTHPLMNVWLRVSSSVSSSALFSPTLGSSCRTNIDLLALCSGGMVALRLSLVKSPFPLGKVGHRHPLSSPSRRYIRCLCL